MTASQKADVIRVLKDNYIAKYNPANWDVDTYIENNGSIIVQKTSRDIYARLKKDLRGTGLRIMVDGGDNEGRINIKIQ